MLEIAVSGSEKNLLQETKLFDDDIISFSLLLSYGKIKDIKSILMRNVCNYNIDVQFELKKLREKAVNKKSIRIWYSSLDNEDFCTLCFIVNYLSDIENLDIYVCDVSDNEHFSLGGYSVLEVSALVNNTKKLSQIECKYYNDLWDKLEEENGDLRIVFNRSLISCDYNYLDSKIIELLDKNDSVYYWSFVGECLRLRLCNFYGDIFFIERINEMIKNGRIVICDVVKEKNFMGKMVDKKYIKVAGGIYYE